MSILLFLPCILQLPIIYQPDIILTVSSKIRDTKYKTEGNEVESTLLAPCTEPYIDDREILIT